MTIQY